MQKELLLGIYFKIKKGSQMNKNVTGMDKINMLLREANKLIPIEEAEVVEHSRVEPVSEKKWWEDGFQKEETLLFMEHLVQDKQFNATQMLKVLNKPWNYNAMYDAWNKEIK